MMLWGSLVAFVVLLGLARADDHLQPAVGWAKFASTYVILYIESNFTLLQVIYDIYRAKRILLL